MKETAIYIHIPFCEHKCIYCDFYSVTSKSKSELYLECLIKEIESYASVYSEGRKIISLYFGGGTPSLMEPEYIGSIIKAVRNNFNLLPNAEITLETNPGTVNKKKLARFLEAGINRLSIGIQSFNEKELKFLTRIHNAQLAEKTVYNAYDSGFENISVDLIFNLPGQSIEKWAGTLERAIAMPVKHISAYSLILEQGTILNKMVIDRKIQMQGDDFDADLYQYSIDFLNRHGFSQYEVSNFSLKGFQSVHNNAYWHYKDYLGFGTSAHSFDNSRRWWNFTSLTFYLKSIMEKGNARAGEETLTEEQKLEEYVMLALRSRGIPVKELVDKFGYSWLDFNKIELDTLSQNGLIEKRDNLIALTSKGYTLCDEILAKFK